MPRSSLRNDLHCLQALVSFDRIRTCLRVEAVKLILPRRRDVRSPPRPAHLHDALHLPLRMPVNRHLEAIIDEGFRPAPFHLNFRYHGLRQGGANRRFDEVSAPGELGDTPRTPQWPEVLQHTHTHHANR